MEDTDQEVQTGPPDQPGCLKKTSRLMRTFWGIITIEPAIFIQTLSWGLQSVISQNLLIEKCCRYGIKLFTKVSQPTMNLSFKLNKSC